MNVETTYELIDNYLNGTLTAEEMAAVKTRLSNDPAFRGEVEAQRAANELIADSESLFIKQQLQKIHIEATGRKKNANSNHKYYYAAAAVAATVSLVMLMLFNDSSDNVSKVANTFVEEKVGKDLSIESSKNKNKTNAVGNTQVIVNSANEKKSNAVSSTIPGVQNSSNSILSKSGQQNSNPSTAQNNNVAAVQSSGIQPVKNLPEKINTKLENTLPNEQGSGLPCTIDFSYSTSGTCKNQKNGTIVFNREFLDVNKSYQFSIDGGNSFYNEGIFEGLLYGEYTLLVEDDNNCKSQPVKAVVEKQDCDYILFPEQQKYWEVPFDRYPGETLTLKITDPKTGKLVFSEIISVDYTWKGQDDNGNILPMGVYAYELAPFDNPNLPVIKASVTIAR